MLIESLNKKIYGQKGFAAILSAMIVMSIILIVIAGLSLTTIIEQKISKNIVQSAQAYYSAESGIEDSLYRLIKNKDYSSSNNMAVEGGNAAITIIDEGNNNKNILARGSVNSRWRSLQIKLDVGAQGASFYYGVQVGEGGLSMNNNSKVIGSIYSDGSIQGSNGAEITGDAWVANKALTLSQQSLANNSDFIFGQASPMIDAAQSFTPSISGNLIKISLLLKKFSSPTNKTVRILTDNNGYPSKALVNSNSYGTLNTSQLDNSSYAWVDVALNAPAVLQAGTKYWILVDSALDEDNYLFWGKDSTDSYGNGTGQYSQNWNAGSPVWSSAGGDIAFKTWFGSSNNFLDNVSVGGNAHANTITDSVVSGDAYFQTLSNTTVAGTQYPGSPDPAIASLPLSDSVISGWKTEAEAGGIITGDYTVDAGAVQTLGPKKIIGNLTVSNSGDLTISGTLYVTGNINIFNNAEVRLGSNFDQYSGAIVNDGTINVSNGGIFFGGADGGYILMLSTKTGEAINIYNNANAAIFYAANGEINVGNNAQLKELTGYKISLSNGVKITYDSGLAAMQFSSGGTGGSWKITDWEEGP